MIIRRNTDVFSYFKEHLREQQIMPLETLRGIGSPRPLTKAVDRRNDRVRCEQQNVVARSCESNLALCRRVADDRSTDAVDKLFVIRELLFPPFRFAFFLLGENITHYRDEESRGSGNNSREQCRHREQFTRIAYAAVLARMCADGSG